MVHLTVPFLSDDEIAAAADDFSLLYNPDEIYPVPIEEIVEFKFEINIVPIPSLQSICEIDAFTSSDFSSIYVDDFVLQYRSTRYRFSLAHEMGHVAMHKGILTPITADIKDIDSWKKFVSEVDIKEYDKLEYQAYMFAGYILVPVKKLIVEFENILPLIDPLVNEAKNNHIPRSVYISYALENAANKLTSVFEVSPAVICRRIKKEGLVSRIP